MDVFLVPIGIERYALYCEVETPVPAESGPTPRSWWGRLTDTFHRALAEAEAERHRDPAAPQPARSRLRRWVTMRLADAVAEQRLLWHLRSQTESTLVHPDDLTPERATEQMRARLTKDFVRHRRWCVIDAVIATASIPVALVPGPNVLGYYFVFRAVGHLLSLRGARRGLQRVTWQARASAPLTAIRAALSGDPAARRDEVQAIAAGLGLARLAAFVEHMSARPS